MHLKITTVAYGLAILGLFGSGGDAAAQSITNVEGVASRATMLIDNGRYNGCGLRFVGLAINPERPVFPTYGWDFNLSMLRRGESSAFVVLKTEASQINSLATAAKDSSRLRRVGDAWLQREGGKPARAYSAGTPGENGLSLLVTYPFDDWLETMIEIAQGQPHVLLLGVKLADEPSTRVFRFAPQVAKEDGEAFTGCVRSLITQLTSPEATGK